VPLEITIFKFLFPIVSDPLIVLVLCWDLYWMSFLKFAHPGYWEVGERLPLASAIGKKFPKQGFTKYGEKNREKICAYLSAGTGTSTRDTSMGEVLVLVLGQAVAG